MSVESRVLARIARELRSIAANLNPQPRETTRPRVHAEAHIEGPSITSFQTGDRHTRPTVNVEVAFDLHDHASALALLDAAVAEVKAQIEESK